MTRILLGVIALALVMILMSWFLPRGVPPQNGGGTSVFGPATLTAHPAPGREGPYEVCENDYDVSLPGGHQIIGRIYAPVLDVDSCRTVDRRFNVVIIAHADSVNIGPGGPAGIGCDAEGSGGEGDWECYDTLGRHLASHAMVVISIHRHPGSITQSDAQEVFDEVLTRNLDWLYNSGESGVEHILSDRIALIGHSAGGKAVTQNAGAVTAFGKDLAALVAMSPTVNAAPLSFNGVVPAVMAIHMTGDDDALAYGSLSTGGPTQSAFKIYDEAGQTGDPDLFGLEKTMVYVRGGSHYYQENLFLRNYVNAFLQTHLNGHAIFRRFLKHQEFPPALSEERLPQDFQIMHEDPVRLAIDDFEDEDREINTRGGSNLFEPAGGFGFVQEGPAWEHDPFSPLSTGLLYFQTLPADQDGAARIAFGLPAPLNVAGYRWLGFRIGQAYHPDLNSEGENQTLSIRIAAEAGSQTVPLTDHGLSVPFPPVNEAPDPLINPRPGVTAANGGTKNALRSYLISLRAFDNIELDEVTAIELIFDGVDQQTIFVLDDLAFYGH
ncbi:MAG: hypothetical protein AAF543_13265 [Pseudomonadota bacterium]